MTQVQYQKQEVYSETLISQKLKPGDKIILLSPASTPERENVENCTKIFTDWGLNVEFGKHIFDKNGFLAGSDKARLEDFNYALRNPDIKAIFATRGGKGAYRIADKLDFTAAKRNPKIILGFSEITILHMALWKYAKLVGMHGPMASWSDDYIGKESINSLQSALMTTQDIVLQSNHNESTAVLTTSGKTSGILLGGNIDMISTSAGWILPNLNGSILLIEGVGMGLGQIDRQLTMLINSGYLKNIKGVAIGSFIRCGTFEDTTVIDVLRDRLSLLNVPILGGLSIGHDKNPLTVPIGSFATLDADNKRLTVAAGVK